MFIYRVYASDASFLSLKDVCIPDGQIQVVLAFARDYDTWGKSTNGDFKAYFDTENVYKKMIHDFKAEAKTPVKFFLSIGGRRDKYSFSVDAASVESWKKRAVNSLRDIIQKYELDGIDVYYEYITASGSVFMDAVGSVIEELTNKGVINVASIAPSSTDNINRGQEKYIELYKKYSGYFTNVVYQCHNEPFLIETAETLKGYLENLPNAYPEPNLLAGHSILPQDWFKVSNAIFYLTIQSIDDNLLSGTSLWTVNTSSLKTHNPEKFQDEP